ncbi:PadR family transcriptional regulator [Lacticaseibacillus daqingensis]|uniref:PadR family transcriptional regulator n=1 Tax=Lacticaseibacillus daqingensis TaxID=2486014 RepID=UPI000F7B0E20|nr:PadR family transcriptional regulator [Lacticaseibacillus daqingensis]
MAQANTSQMLKGVLQGCLLMLLADEPSYGYAITQRLNEFGFDTVPKGTIYPLLMTMEKKGLLASTMRASPDGPERKYYHPTPAGLAAKQDFLLDWQILSTNVARIVQLEANHHE